MTTETDLSYYETELPKVIAGVRRGEKFEHDRKCGQWFEPSPANQNPTELSYYIKTGRRVRLAPVPVVKWWDCPADVPGPTCWIRERGAENYGLMIIGIRPEGVTVCNSISIGADKSPELIPWSYFPNLEHSTDLRNWSDCVKPEGGK